MTEANKLDETNYVNRKFKIQTLLKAVMAWEIVLGKEDRPETSANLVQDWDHRERKVKVLLRMSIKDNIIPHIRECKTSTATWSTLKGMHET